MLDARAVRRLASSIACGLALGAVSAPASALDKQGSAHGGHVGGATTDFNISGGATLGASLYNPTYAARPDNTGLALFRYALHADVDLIGRYLSIPLDLNLFTDRQRRRWAIFAPSEFDVIAGLTSTNGIRRGLDLEVGARVEDDRPVDRGSYDQLYADVRARLLLSAAAMAPGVGPALRDGDLSGQVTLGWFAVNPSYAARPDNSGRALFRYGLHSELGAFERSLALGVDTTLFSDRQAHNAVRPSELDVTLELIGRRASWEAHLAYERDMPIDRGGRVQSLLYLLACYAFDFRDVLHPTPPPR